MEVQLQKGNRFYILKHWGEWQDSAIYIAPN